MNGTALKLRDVAVGSDEERELRSVWLSRVMFLPFAGGYEGRSYEEWLEAAGYQLV